MFQFPTMKKEESLEVTWFQFTGQEAQNSCEISSCYQKTRILSKMSVTVLEGQRNLAIGIPTGQTVITYLSIKRKIKLWLNGTRELLKDPEFIMILRKKSQYKRQMAVIWKDEYNRRYSWFSHIELWVSQVVPEKVGIAPRIGMIAQSLWRGGLHSTSVERTATRMFH